MISRGVNVGESEGEAGHRGLEDSGEGEAVMAGENEGEEAGVLGSEDPS